MDPEPGDQVVDCAGATVMPGLVESHAHLTFPSAVGHIDPSFNPPLDVSFFRHMPTPDEHLAIAERNAKILLEHGFTSVYSAGSLTPVPTEVRLREAIAAGATPGPRMRAASFERDNNPVQMGPDGPRPKKTGPEGVREFIAEQAAIGFDSVKLLMSNDDVFTEGGSMITQYSPEEARAAGEQARESGVWLNCHAQAPESIKLAVRNGFRSVYHCTYADAEAIDGAGGAQGLDLPVPRRRHHVGQRVRGRRVRHRHRDGGEDGLGEGAAGDDRAVPRAAQARAPGAAGRRLRLPEQPDRAQRQGPRAVRPALRLLAGRGSARGHAVRRPGDGPAGRAADAGLPGRRAGRARRAGGGRELLQDPGNLLAIMQNGAFFKLADQLAAA